MATLRRAKLKAATPDGLVYWANGEKFNGYLMLGLATPSGYASVGFDNATRRLRLPQWIAIRIIDGEIDKQAQVFFNADLNPPNTLYVAYFYDVLKHRIAPSGAAAPFTIDADPYAITVPVLPIPAAAVLMPVPESEITSIVATSTLLGITETPTGTVDGVNDTFTVSQTPVVLILTRNGVVQKPGVDYNRTGATITFLAGAIPQTSDELAAFVFYQG